MDFNEYQDKALDTAIYPGQGTITGLSYATLGIAGEAGELANKVKKIIRDHSGFISDDWKQDLAAELSDVLWYAAALANELDTTLDEVAEYNVAKLASRAKRGVIKGTGDDR